MLNNQKDNKNRKITITSKEFIRKFLLHVLPDKIRHFDLLSNKKSNIRHVHYLFI